MPHPKHGHDFCSCPKPDHWWGEGGWHQRLQSDKECIFRFGEEGCFRGVDESTCQEMGGCVHAGVPVAEERCPRYHSKVIESRLEKRRQDAEKGSKRLFS